MTIFQLAWQSAWSRKTNLLLAILSIAISATLLLGVDSVRKATKSQFLNTISQTDLIVGARSGPVNLLLYSIFHIGNATNNMRYSSYEAIAQMPQVAWTVPISLGDSHKGYRVLGTEAEFYQFFKFANEQPLHFREGNAFQQIYDVVIGSEVAKKLDYSIGDRIVLSHGIGMQGAAHSDKPFVITGILAPTATPIDRTLQVSLRAIEAIHIDWQAGHQSPLKINAQLAAKFAAQPKEITAILVGLKNPVHTFKLQRHINEFGDEPLLAILPGSTLIELWKSIGIFENVLLTISALVLLAGLIGMLITLISTLNERRHEIAVLRSIGIHRLDILKLFAFESLLIMLSGIVAGVTMLYTLFWILSPWSAERFGIILPLPILDSQQLLWMLAAIATALIISLVPGLMAYRNSLQDGLTVKL